MNKQLIEDIATEVVCDMLRNLDSKTSNATRQRSSPCGDVLAGQLHMLILEALTEFCESREAKWNT